jgi:hypothetical protein
MRCVEEWWGVYCTPDFIWHEPANVLPAMNMAALPERHAVQALMPLRCQLIDWWMLTGSCKRTYMYVHYLEAKGVNI